MAQDKQYLNGVFVDKKNGQYGQFYNIHIPNLEVFIQNLRNMPLNDRGGLRLVLTDKQSNPAEGSIYLNTFVPTTGNTSQPLPQRTPPPATPPQAPKQTTTASAGSKSGLPF